MSSSARYSIAQFGKAVFVQVERTALSEIVHLGSRNKFEASLRPLIQSAAIRLVEDWRPHDLPSA